MTPKTLVTAAALLFCGTLTAQDIYKVEALSGSDLNGTARYVGMGGAMSALGADLSVMGTNPAGIGLYRRSDVAFSGGLTDQPNARQAFDIHRIRPSFDQAGFVYAWNLGDDAAVKYVNFGFNYQKRRNFKNYAEKLGGTTGGWSQTDLFHQISSGFDLADDKDRDGMLPIVNAAYDAQLSTLPGSSIVLPDEPGNEYRYAGPETYNLQRVTWGGIQQYDFNVAFNINDRFYAGLTAGFYNVNYHSALYYDEDMYFASGDRYIISGDGALPYYYSNQEEKVTGTGFDLKLGFICRPFEDSSFRVGFSVATPIFFDLTQTGYVYFNSPFGAISEGDPGYSPYADYHDDYTEGSFMAGSFDYRIRTPWTVNLSMGGTVGSVLALGAEYEVKAYKSCSVGYPSYDDYYWDSDTDTDYAMNDEVDTHLKAQHILRLGAEAQFVPGFFVRAGYNYLSSPFRDGAHLNLFTSSPSYYARTNTDYLNLGDTHRATFGLGYRGKHFYADVAYQFQRQRGDLYPFATQELDYPEGMAGAPDIAPAKVKLDRHNVLFTVGYKF